MDSDAHLLNTSWPQLFKSWIALSIGEISIQRKRFWETNCTVEWIEMYPVDSAIHLLNNCGLMIYRMGKITVALSLPLRKRLQLHVLLRCLAIHGERIWTGEEFWSPIPVPVSQHFRLSKFCHLYPEYHFLFKYHIPCKFEECWLSSGQIPYPVKKFCVLQNLALYFIQIPDPEIPTLSIPCSETSVSIKVTEEGMEWARAKVFFKVAYFQPSAICFYFPVFSSEKSLKDLLGSCSHL